MVRVRAHRVYFCGLRCHHGLTGMALLAASLLLGSRRLFVAGALLTAHDWRDRPWPLIDP